MNTPSTTATRSYCLDNLKVALTVLVIAHHAMIPFVGGEGWPFHPTNAAESMPWMWHFLNTNAAFFMGLFFMISGYFVPKSFDRQGFSKFNNIKCSLRHARIGTHLVSEQPIYVLFGLCAYSPCVQKILRKF